MKLPFKLRIFSKILFFIFVQMCLLVLALLGLDTAYFLFFLLSFVLVIDIVLFMITLLSAVRIEVLRDVTDKITEGDYLSVKLSFSNKGFLPLFNSAIVDFLECDIEEKYRRFFFNWVRPSIKVVLDYGCVCELRGLYTLGPVKLRFYDFLSFFYMEKEYRIESKVYVYPKAFTIKRMIESARGDLPWLGLETRVVSSDDYEFFGVREYKEGDPIKRIHWFSTAKNNELVVREYQVYRFYQAALLFVLTKEENFGAGKENITEYIIKMTASLAKYFIEKDICVEILSHTGRLNHFPPNKGLYYLDEIFKFCAMIKAESKISLNELLQEYFQYASMHSTIFVLLTDRNIQSFLQGMHFKKYNISVVALVILSLTFSLFPPTKVEIDILKVKLTGQLSKAKISVLFFSKGDNLEEAFF